MQKRFIKKKNPKTQNEVFDITVNDANNFQFF